MKIGRRKVAELLTHKSGHKILLVNRTMKDVVKGRGNKMISHAMEEDEACWPVESLLLSRMKHRGIPLLAVQVKSNKSVYMSRLASWISDSKVHTGAQAQRVGPAHSALQLLPQARGRREALGARECLLVHSSENISKSAIS